jgi:hypothetical protein
MISSLPISLQPFLGISLNVLSLEIGLCPVYMYQEQLLCTSHFSHYF